MLEKYFEIIKSNVTKEKKKCKICDMMFESLTGLDKHYLDFHKEIESNKKFYCGHNGCMRKFKTKKQMISHHNLNDKECRNKKIAVIKKISEYKNKILEKLKAGGNSKKKEEIINKIESMVINCSNNLFDNEFFNVELGNI